jgi:hypothetical protein
MLAEKLAASSPRGKEFDTIEASISIIDKALRVDSGNDTDVTRSVNSLS